MIGVHHVKPLLGQPDHVAPGAAAHVEHAHARRQACRKAGHLLGEPDVERALGKGLGAGVIGGGRLAFSHIPSLLRYILSML